MTWYFFRWLIRHDFYNSIGQFAWEKIQILCTQHTNVVRLHLFSMFRVYHFLWSAWNTHTFSFAIQFRIHSNKMNLCYYDWLIIYFGTSDNSNYRNIKTNYYHYHMTVFVCSLIVCLIELRRLKFLQEIA